MEELYFECALYLRIYICISDSNIEKTGLLLTTSIQDPEDPEQTRVLSQFVHLSIQEYLAMLGLLTKEDDHFKNIVKQLSRSQQFNMALLFLYGIAFDESEVDETWFSFSIAGRVDPQQLDAKRKMLTHMASVST